MQKNVTSQKLMVFAWDSTTGLPKTGDAANITAYVSKDYGSVTVLGDTSATEMDSTNAKGYYLFDLTQAETNADTLLFSAKSSTSNIAVVGAPATVFTTPPNFSLLSVNGSGQVVTPDTQKVDVNTIKTNPVVNAGTVTFPTTATLASTTNITAGTVTTATNLTNAPTSGDFTAAMKASIGTAVAASAVASVTGSVGSVAGDVGGDVLGGVIGSVGSVVSQVIAIVATDGLTRASFAADTGLQTARSGTAQAGAAGSITLDSGASAVTDFYKDQRIHLTGGTGAGQERLCTAYNGATKVATVTPNWATNPTGSTTFAALAAAWVAGISGPVGSVSGAVGSVSGSVGSVVGSVDLGSINGVTLSGNVGANFDAFFENNGTASVSIVDDVANTLDDTGAIKAKTDNLNFTGTGGTGLVKADVQDWKGAAAPALSALLDAVLVESGISAGAGLVNDAGAQLTSINARQALAAILSSVAAVLSGAATTAVAVKPAGKPSASDRIDATVDADGNRSAVNLRVPT